MRYQLIHASPAGLSVRAGSGQDTPAGLWRIVPSAQRMLARGMASKVGTTGNASAATRSRKGIIGGRAIILSSMCPYLALSTCTCNSCVIHRLLKVWQQCGKDIPSQQHEPSPALQEGRQ